MPNFNTKYECQFCLEKYTLSVYVEKDLSGILDVKECPHCNKSPDDLGDISFDKFQNEIIEKFCENSEEEYHNYRESLWESKMCR